MSSSLASTRIIAVVGATGTGKSELAVALAESFNGEIINADAMQMYDGLPVATNQLPFPERKSIPHHLLGCIKPTEDPWNVGKYVRAATKIIESIVARGKLPILVGGTHYYMQSLLFKRTLVNQLEPEGETVEAQEIKWPILAASTSEMLEQLRRVDPELATKWHPHDRRKIRHSLEVYLTSGRQPSNIYREQREAASPNESRQFPRDQCNSLATDNTSSGAPSLQLDPLVLWTYAELDKLSTRLNTRVEQMVEDGLIEEILSLHKSLQNFEQTLSKVDQTSGIWTAIGFKEFASYITASSAGNSGSDHIEKLKQDGVNLTQIATRQYARQQQRWIRGKLLRALQDHHKLDQIVLLDSTQLAQWQQNVEEPAVHAVSTFLKGNPPLASPTVVHPVLVPIVDPNVKARYCNVCNATVMTQREWDAHPRSKRHRKATTKPIDWQALYPKSHGRKKISYAKAESSSG
ncbi:MAG: hypothetical protein Q9194_000209 [Teloschistes cf. exilis]